MAPHKRKRDVQKELNRQKADRHVGGSLLDFFTVHRLSTAAAGSLDIDDEFW